MDFSTRQQRGQPRRVGSRHQRRFAQLALSLPTLLGEDVAGVGVTALELSIGGPAKAFGRPSMGFQFHYSSPLQTSAPPEHPDPDVLSL